MAKGIVYKDYYPISKEQRKNITKKESTEEIDNYFEFLTKCLKHHICSECWTPVEFDDTWLPDEVREFQFSAMCKDCQRKIFGL